MSRHLFVGTGVSASYSNGILADGKVGFQKLSANGPTAIGASDTIADSDQIRVVQGTPNGNKVSPWIYGRNVIVFSGVDYAAPVSHKGTVTVADGNSTSAGEVVVKFVRTGGPRPEIFKFSTVIATNTSNADSAQAIVDAFAALSSVPEWLNKTATRSSGVVTFAGSLRGDVTKSGGTWEYDPPMFEIIIESSSVATSTFTAANSAKADPGTGDGNSVRYYEETLQGVSDGFYNRRNLPIQPTLHAVASSNYDMATIVATKDGSTSPQIKGVDNLIEISIALVDVAGTGASLAIDAGLNSYMASTPGAFAAVSFVKAS